LRSALLLVLGLGASSPASAQVLDSLKLLEAETFWDNRDWDWYEDEIPFFECPDAEIQTTYYYRWELLTKHLTYGSPNSGYSFTEFIDRPFWSGAYGAISCPAGHQLYEARWLKSARVARDYARYWLRTPGAQPRRYSTWLADAVWAVHLVHPDAAFTGGLQKDLEANYEAWERSHFTPAVGLFWQTGHDDGMEININSRQTADTVRGAPAYRPTLNAYLFADALAIARTARLNGDGATAERYEKKAAGLKERLHALLWDLEREFFFPMSMRDEERDGHVVKAMALTYRSGRFAGDPHGRELIGYVPWQFSMAEPGREAAWRFLMDPERFFAARGPTTVERRDPLFLISKTCCVWSGQSWPYATTQTLVAFANLLQGYEQDVVTKADYFHLFKVYAATHRKDGRPYIAEAAHPDTGSWEGHDGYNHSEHYFHSGFVDPLITGLAGLRPRDDEVVEVNPLAPDDWSYFALDGVAYRGHRLSILWDRDGSRYGRGAGLRVLAGGKEIAASPRLGRLEARLPARPAEPPGPPLALDYAVNNDGAYFPRLSASFTSPGSSLGAANDGNYWYHRSPPNRWSAEGSPSKEDWIAVDFGAPRRIDTVKLYFLDDGEGAAIAPPERYEVETWTGGAWRAAPSQSRTPPAPAGRRANAVRFPALETSKLRVVLTHRGESRSGLSEIEAWGPGALPFAPPPPPAGNLALNARGEGRPRASASHTSRFDRVAMANDGIVSYKPSPQNRWTAYESPSATDWLEIDLGEERAVGRAVLHIYDDRGGVQPPASYTVEFWSAGAWREAAQQRRTPAAPAGGQANEVAFAKVKTSKLRVVFTHRGKARSGVSEIEVWEE
jgi:hypothetical protein